MKKKKTNEIITAYAFMLPALISILLFVFFPIIFSFLVSLFKEPTIIQLSEDIFGFYTTYSNLNFRKLYDFFFGVTTTDDIGIFLLKPDLETLVLAIILLIYMRICYKQLIKLIKLPSYVILVIAVLTGLAISPLVITIFRLIFQLLYSVGLPGLPLENYRIVLTRVQLDFSKILFNTVFWTFVCTFLHVILGIFLAVLLNQDFKGKGFFRGIFILPWAIPSFASTLIWKNFIFRQEGYLGARTTDIFGEPSYAFTTASLVSVVIAILAIVLIFMIIDWAIEKRIKIHPSYRMVLRLIILIFAVVIGLQIYDILNPFINLSSGSLLSYKIVDIPDTTTGSFWISAEIRLFGKTFRMITFSAILVNTWLGVPFMMVSFLAALQSIPQDLYEAAEIDGATSWQKFQKITFPLLKPTLFTVSLLGIIWTFNLFNVVYLLSQNTNIPDQTDFQIFVTFIYDLFQGPHLPQYAQAAALSFIVFLILTAFSRAYNKIFDAEKMFIGEAENLQKKPVKYKKKQKGE